MASDVLANAGSEIRENLVITDIIFVDYNYHKNQCKTIVMMAVADDHSSINLYAMTFSHSLHKRSLFLL